MKETKTIIKDIEILSPVGSEEMLTAAVRSGADAVYLGMRDFNARRSADNFDGEGLASAVKYCHVRGVAVYLTLNTLLSDDELPSALKAAALAYKVGVDAVIVQDVGLARVLREQLPDLPLHASTQLTAHSIGALEYLKSFGFSRVVISREMSREEIKAFCQRARELDISVEAFVHGALCMSMSGQCYLSAMLGSRSGNRGLCAGPCRLPFSSSGDGRFDLSLKDLSLAQYIDEMRALGVVSFKIEGRMKRPEYVAAATATCRKATDGIPDYQLFDTLYKVFSRSGFTDGYYKGALGADMFGIRTKDDVLTSAAVIKSLHELYRSERQSIRITGEFTAKTGSEISLTVSDGSRKITVYGDCPERAERRAADRESVLSQLNKTGGTPFVFDDIKTDIESDIALGAGALNSLRREALSKLSEARYEERPEIPQKDIKKSVPSEKKHPVFYARFSSPSQIPESLDGIELVILPLESDFESVIHSKKIAVEIPRGIENEDFILKRLSAAKKAGITAAFCGNIAAVTLCKTAGLTPYYDFSMNTFNSQSAAAASELDAMGVTLSFELTTKQLNEIGSPIKTGVIGYGRVPLMLTRNCPLKNTRSCKDCDREGFLTDRKGIRFPVRCRMGYSELLNSRPIYLAERVSEFNVDYMTLYFTVESREECGEIIERYKKGLPPAGEYTRGLYYRGVE